MCIRDRHAVDEVLDATKCSGTSACHNGKKCSTHDLWHELNVLVDDYLDKNPKINIKSVSIDDSEFGLSVELLDWSDIVIWWGHVRHDDIPDETVDNILSRLTNGELDFIALHSAHWAKPFIKAMNYKTISNVKKDNPQYFDNSDYAINYIEPFEDREAPQRKDILTPRVELRKFPSGKINANIYLPNNCFPAYRPDGKSSFIHSLKSDHPIMNLSLIHI